MAEYNRYGRPLTAEEVEGGEHRALVGGLWDEIGELQLDFMVSEAGLTPGMKLLDLGCGSLRGGVHFVDYLDPGNYYGLDINASLIDAGWEVEIPRYGLGGKLTRDRLLVTDDFGAWRFGTAFDRVIAVSLWTHLPLNHLQRSLREAITVLKPGGALYASVFLCGSERRLFEAIEHRPGGIITHRDRDPYHYTWGDIRHVCTQLGVRAELVGDWNHPRAQQMVRIAMPLGP